MIKYSLTFLFAIINLICNSQIKTKSAYYHDSRAYNRSYIFKSDYKLTKTIIGDSIKKEELINCQTNNKVWYREFLRKAPYGEWIFYDDSGKIGYKLNYNFFLKYGKKKPVNFYEVNIENQELMGDIKGDFTMPILNSKYKNIGKYISSNTFYPVFARENGFQGSVYIQITIDIEGNISNILIAQGVEESLDREALRVIYSMPKFTPAKLDKKPINIYMVIPITYKLN